MIEARHDESEKKQYSKHVSVGTFLCQEHNAKMRKLCCGMSVLMWKHRVA